MRKGLIEMPRATTEEERQKLIHETPKNLSRHQYGTLKFIADNKVSISYLRMAHAGTLWSLAQPGRGYLKRLGPEESALVILTKAGEEALRAYESASLRERSHEADLTERCERLLRYSARRGNVQPFSKAG